MNKIQIFLKEKKEKKYYNFNYIKNIYLRSILNLFIYLYKNFH